MFIWSIWNQHKNSKRNDDLWLPTYMKSKYQTIMGQKKACWTYMWMFLKLWNFIVAYVQKCSQMFIKYFTIFTTHSYASNVFSRVCKSASWSSYLFHIKWLQSKVVYFLCCNPVFCKVSCIYMLLTWHKNYNFPNLWLHLDFQPEKEDIYKKFLQHIYTKYTIIDFWNWELWIGLLFVHLYTCIFVYEFYLRYIIRTQYIIC
jgi:hypothetical protein